MIPVAYMPFVAQCRALVSKDDGSVPSGGKEFFS